MRQLSIIGIGAGDPAFLTVQAIDALNAVDVFFVLDKGSAVGDLARARQEICDRYITSGRYRIVALADPPRDRAPADYIAAVREWDDRRAEVLERAIAAEVPDGGHAGLLVWGDPAWYDGAIRVAETMLSRGHVQLDYRVIPGISSVQVLAARHRITLNQVGGPVQVTTGRRLAAGLPDGCDDILVMLDAGLACAAFRDQDLDIYWGAYLGTPDETLIAGRLGDVIDDIARVRRTLRDRKGWIMDTYLLRRRSSRLPA